MEIDDQWGMCHQPHNMIKTTVSLFLVLFATLSPASSVAGPVEELIAFIDTHVTMNPKSGDTANLTFFTVGLRGKPDLIKFRQLVQDLDFAPQPGQERSYIELGGILEDQGYALKCMGLGQLLGEWQLLSPDTVMPDLPKELKQMMAGQGLITIVSLPKNPCEKKLK